MLRWSLRSAVIVVSTLCATCASLGASLAPATAATVSASTSVCRADGPIAEGLLPIVEPIVSKWLGVHPDSTTPGISIAVVEPDPAQPNVSRTLVFSCGVTEKGGSDPVVPTTRFEIGSESKLFTATALAHYVLAGRVGLDQPATDFLTFTTPPPDAACGHPVGSPITLRDLATHNAGLRDDPKNVTWDATHPEGHADYTRDDLLQSFDAFSPTCDALLFDPGTGYSYSDWGFATLGMLLADVYEPGDGVPAYGPMVDALVTGPLGMTATGLPAPSPPADLAVPTCPAGVVTPCYWDNVNAYAGGGGLVSNAPDLARFVTANLGFDRSSPLWPALALTHQPAGHGAPGVGPMGLGWQLADPGPLSAFTMLEKNGGTWGSHSQTYLVPDACWGVTVLSNSDSPSAVGDDGVGGDLVRALAPRAASTACAAPATPAAAVTVVPAFTG